MTRSIAFAFAGIVGLFSLALLTGCEPPGDGTRWSCATAYAGSAEGVFFPELDEGGPSEGTFVAMVRLATFENGLEDVNAAAGDEVWVLDGQYEEIEGPFPEDQKLREFLAVVQEDGTLVPVVDDPTEGSSFALSGSIDLDGDCTAEGTWEFTGGSDGTWQARP